MEKPLNIAWHWDPLSFIMVTLVAWLGLWVGLYARRYMTGDRHQVRFGWRFLALCISLIIAFTADFVPIFLLAWCSSYLLLVQLMIHKPQWPAARAAGFLAGRYFLLGMGCIAAGLMMLVAQTHSLSLEAIVQTDIQTLSNVHAAEPEWWIGLALGIMALGACMVSGLWPFHRWLLSSLNSPTPVSAMMHAGLINGGGFLLAHFAPLYLQYPYVLHLLFIVGLISAVLGTTWKLMQTDIKRFLACSTLSQMGIMMVQCSLGLFASAVTHLCWHGLYKAYAFLSAGQATERFESGPVQSPRLPVFIYALLCGIASSALFAWCANEPWLARDTSLFLTLICTIASAQVVITGSQYAGQWSQYVLCGVQGLLFGALYGLSVGCIQWILLPLDLFLPQAWEWWHTAGSLLLFCGWLALIWSDNLQQFSAWGSKQWATWYVWQLNASQPEADTVTSDRNHYPL